MKNKININNYEAFLLDYMEGNLSVEDLVALQLFAAQHPELNIDLNNLELVELETEKVSFNEKNNLKKVSDGQFVAYIENQLSDEERNSIESICSDNTTLAIDLKLYKATITTADETIIFEHKNLLKKQETKVIWLFSREVLAAAASLVLLFGLWLIFRGALTDDNLNSEKIDGINKIKTFALKNTTTVPSFTIEKTIENPSSNNPVAYSNINPVKKEKKINEDIKEEHPLVANNIPQKDTSIYKPKEILPVVKTDQLADNSTKPSTITKAYIITEKAYDEDEKVASGNKKGFWYRAINALNGLNKLGVKNAKGSETVEQHNEQHVLTMGNFKVENHKYNAE